MILPVSPRWRKAKSKKPNQKGESRFCPPCLPCFGKHRQLAGAQSYRHVRPLQKQRNLCSLLPFCPLVSAHHITRGQAPPSGPSQMFAWKQKLLAKSQLRVCPVFISQPGRAVPGWGVSLFPCQPWPLPLIMLALVNVQLPLLSIEVNYRQLRPRLSASWGEEDQSFCQVLCHSCPSIFSSFFGVCDFFADFLCVGQNNFLSTWLYSETRWELAVWRGVVETHIWRERASEWKALGSTL